MTKEAKLTAAQRIIKEWPEYDSQIKNLMAKVDEAEHEDDSKKHSDKDSEEKVQNIDDKEQNSHTEL